MALHTEGMWNAVAIENDLLDIYDQTVQIFRYLSTNKYAEDKYAETPDVLPCRLEGATAEVITPTGSKAAAIGTAFLTDVYPWLTEKCDMKVQNLNGGYDWVELLNVDTHYDQNGPYYQVLYYGRPMAGGTN